jgi:RecA-family ATPase
MSGLAERPTRALGAPVFEQADLRDLMTRDIPQPAFVIERIVPAVAVTLLGGHGGTGKSILGLTLAAHVAAHRSWCGRIVHGGRAVFLSLEDPASIVLHRLKRIITEYDLPPAAVVANLDVFDGSDIDAALMREVAEGGRRELHETKAMRELHERIGDAALIVVDTASDAFDANENERRKVRQFVRRLARLGREKGAAILLLAHVDKQTAKNVGRNGASQHYSGSSAWHNSARSRLALIPSNHEVELVHEKANFTRTAEPLLLSWSERGVLMPSDLVPNEGRHAIANAQAEADADAVLEALRDATARGVSVPTGRTGPSTAHAVLQTLAALPKHLRGREGRERFWAGLSALECAGSIAVESYRNADRKLRHRFATAPVCARANSPITPTNWSGAGPLSPPICADSETGAESAQTGASDVEEETL